MSEALLLRMLNLIAIWLRVNIMIMLLKNPIKFCELTMNLIALESSVCVCVMTEE